MSRFLEDRTARRRFEGHSAGNNRVRLERDERVVRGEDLRSNSKPMVDRVAYRLRFSSTIFACILRNPKYYCKLNVSTD